MTNLLVRPNNKLELKSSDPSVAIAIPLLY